MRSWVVIYVPLPSHVFGVFHRVPQVIDPTYTQMVMQLPPENATNNPAFVHDYFQSFTSTLFIGCEVRPSQRGRWTEGHMHGGGNMPRGIGALGM